MRRTGDTSERFELLAAMARVADGSLTLPETVQRLLEILVPAFADVATLDAGSVAGELQRLGALVDGPLGGRLESALLRRRKLADGGVGAARAIASGRSHLLSPVPDEHLRELASDAADLEALRGLALRSALFVPLRSRGRTVGALACAVGPSGRDYSDGDLQFAEVLAGRIALALDNTGLSETVSALEQRLEAALANLAEAVLVRDRTGRIMFANRAAARLLGVGSVEEVTAAPPGSLMARFDVFDTGGRPVSLADLPAASAQRGEPAEPMLVRNVVRATGEERWLINKATPVFDRSGAVSLVVSVIEDVTALKRAELAQQLLAQAGKELSSSLDYQQTLQRVVKLAVPRLADWCGVTMRGDGDRLCEVAAFDGRGETVAVSEVYGAGEVITSGEPLLLADVGVDGESVPPERRARLGSLEVRSIMIVPLALGGRSPIGALTLAMVESGRSFDEGDLALAEELGRRAATAVENARLYTERSRIAATLQRGLQPPKLPSIPRFQLASLYQPAGNETEVGGDFYDAFEVPGGWMVLVGDVAGRGAEAATLTSLSRYTLRAAGKLLGDPIGAFGELNSALREQPRLSLVSVCCAVLRESSGRAFADVALAGHPPPYLVRGGAVRGLGEFGPFLGAYESGGWSVATVALEPEDQLVFYTDGVIDTVGKTERFGEDRLVETLRKATGAVDAVRRIAAELSSFAEGPPVDDTAVLAVERCDVVGGPGG